MALPMLRVMRIPRCAALALVLLSPTAASAMDKRACVAASDDAQRLRSAGHLLEARAKLVACADASCPSIVREACGSWLNEVATAIPSIVLAAKETTPSCDPHGAPVERDLVDVDVSIDGRHLASKLDGRAAELDPGTHALRLRAGVSHYDASIVVQEGAKLRPIDATLAGPPPICSTATVGTGPIVAAGLSAASLGTFAYFALRGNGRYHQLLGSCGPSCSPDEVSPVTTDFVVADVALGLGIVAAGVATWLFLAPRSHVALSAIQRGALLRVPF